MNLRSSLCLVSLPALLPMLLCAQVARQHDPVALKHWAAPLYWQPTQATTEEHGVVPVAKATGLPATANPLVFVAMTPCRVVDTRSGSQLTNDFGPPSLIGGASRTFPILSSTACSIPSIAQAYSFEITVVPPGPLAYVTAFPTGLSSPVAAIAVESPQGLMVSNTGIVPAGTNGSVDVYAAGPTDIVIDVNGYYAPITGAFGNTALGLGALVNDTPNVPAAAGPSGTGNTAIGSQALQTNTSGALNTATGSNALQANTSGQSNTANGAFALQSNTTGGGNTATGTYALADNTAGVNNTANGDAALAVNTTGVANTAIGFSALSNNTASLNTAVGSTSLGSNTTGSDNTAVGNSSLLNNTSGRDNTATGAGAMLLSTTGDRNTVIGSGGLGQNTTGSLNVAIGINALGTNTSGSNSVAIGSNAAVTVSGTNSNNIHIGSAGAAADSNTIRIGGTQALGDTATQNRFFAAGIRGITTGNNDAIPVMIDSAGQLGTVSSSIRFKEDVQDMGDASSGLMELHPVTFRYQKPFADGSKPIQYGLIAEEVAKVYPDLVAQSADGQIETVKYQVLDSMLLNELQKEHQQIQEQAETILLLEARLATLEKALLSNK